MRERCGISADGAQSPPPAESNARLPCRGCCSDCIHYANCDGRPWRTLVRETRPRSQCVEQRMADGTGTIIVTEQLARGATCLN